MAAPKYGTEEYFRTHVLPSIERVAAQWGRFHIYMVKKLRVHVMHALLIVKGALCDYNYFRGDLC